MSIAEWLASGIHPPEGETLAYLERRGVGPSVMGRVDVGIWVPPATVAPDSSFRARCGPRGEKIAGRIVLPLYTPRGEIMGIEARSMTKELTGYRVPHTKWAPAWVTTKNPSEGLWNNGRAWIVEGFFDLAALVRVVPEADVVIATLRAGMNRIQIEHLRRFCRGGVVVAYDNDEAGRRATHGYQEGGRRKFGIVDYIEREGLHVTACRYLGKDPGDIWLNKGDRGLLQAFGALTI